MAAFQKPALLFALFAIGAAGCQKASNGGDKCTCQKDLMCTADFRSVSLRIRSTAGAPVVLDSFYTIRQASGEILRTASPGPTPIMNGAYPVLSDGGTSRVCGEDFEFRGFKDGVQVVSEPYRIRFDCCHVERVSGKEEVVL